MFYILYFLYSRRVLGIILWIDYIVPNSDLFSFFTFFIFYIFMFVYIHFIFKESMNRLDRPQFPSIPSHNSILSPQLHFNGKIRKQRKKNIDSALYHEFDAIGCFSTNFSKRWEIGLVTYIIYMSWRPESEKRLYFLFKNQICLLKYWFNPTQRAAYLQLVLKPGRCAMMLTRWPTIIMSNGAHRTIWIFPSVCETGTLLAAHYSV